MYMCFVRLGSHLLQHLYIPISPHLNMIYMSVKIVPTLCYVFSPFFCLFTFILRLKNSPGY
jgi:hypothetical protein